MTGKRTRGEVRAPAVTPRSYIVDTPSGQLRWNSRHLTPVPEEQPEEKEGSPEETRGQGHQPVRSPIMTRFRTVVLIRPPARYQMSPEEGELWNNCINNCITS